MNTLRAQQDARLTTKQTVEVKNSACRTQKKTLEKVGKYADTMLQKNGENVQL